MQTTTGILQRLGTGRSPVIAVALVAVATMPVAAHAQAAVPAPPAPIDARLGLPSEQNQPGAEDLAAARAAAMNGDWEEALDRFRLVLSQHQNGELADDATYWIARSLQGLGRYVEAVTAVNDFVRAYPRSSLLGDARIIRFRAAEELVRQGNADYERYLRDEAPPVAPPPPPPGPPGQQVEAPPAPPDVDSDLRLMALDALIGMDPEAAWPLLEQLVSEPNSSPALRQRSMWLLSEIGTDEAFDLLIQMARTDPDPEVRGQALFWVGQSESHEAEAIDLLVEMVRTTDDEDLLGQALFGLGQTDDPRAREVMEELARDSSKSTDMRGQALFWLGQQGGSLDLLAEIALNDPDEELRGQAMFGISQIDSEEANQFLLEIARSDGPIELRSNAIFWLGQRGDERIVDVLVSLWDEVDDDEMRNQLLFALSQTDSDAAIDHMVKVATDETLSAELRGQAVFWLGQSESPKARQALLDIIGGGAEPVR